MFFVADCERALRFYMGLGFREASRHSEDNTLVALQVNRDGTELILNRNTQHKPGGGRVFITLDPGEVARCTAAFTAAGVKVRDAHWGMPVKIVEDPDGNDLVLHDDEMGDS